MVCLIACDRIILAITKERMKERWICGYLEPLSAVVFAAILLGELMTPFQIIGTVCIIGGAMVGELVKTKKFENQ